jgi:YgiT-type zinc finger domain-containing protein
MSGKETGHLIDSRQSTVRASLPPCKFCGGECESQLITLTLRRSKYSFAVIRNVPADVCQNCGESLFSVSTAGKLLSTLQTGRKPDEVALIPIFDLAAAS